MAYDANVIPRAFAPDSCWVYETVDGVRVVPFLQEHEASHPWKTTNYQRAPLREDPKTTRAITK